MQTLPPLPIPKGDMLATHDHFQIPQLSALAADHRIPQARLNNPPITFVEKKCDGHKDSNSVGGEP
jgi:hypothetical protein